MENQLIEEISERVIEKRIKDGNFYLLGQVPVNNSEIEKLYEYAKTVSEKNYNYLNEFSSNLMLSLALVQIAIYEYQDGNYWDRFCDKLNIPELNSSQKILFGKIFFNTIEKYSLFKLNEDYSPGKRNQYVENIKAHAFITNNYMKDYYEFLNDFYENNLFRDLSGDLEDSLQDLSDYIKTIRNSEKDTIPDEYKTTTKSYKLLKSSRAVIAQCDGDILYQLFYPSLKLIDENFFDGVIPSNTDNRFVKVFIEWINEKEAKNPEGVKSVNERKKYSKKPFIAMTQNLRNEISFKLVIPRRNYRMSECDGSVKAEIIIDGFSKKIALNVHTNLGMYISEEYTQRIDNPINRFEIIINTEHFIIDNSNYALFDSNNNNINKLSKDDDNFLFTNPSTSVRFSKSNYLKDSYSYTEYDFYQFYADENTVCYIDNSPLSIIGKYTEEPIFEEMYYGEIVDNKNHKVAVGRIHPSISFTIDENEILGTVLNINNNRFLINNEKFQITNHPNNESKKILSIDINQLLEPIDGEYTIILDIPGKNNRLIANYLILRKFYYRFDKFRYIYEPIAKLKVKIDDLDIKCISDNVKLTYYNKIAKNNYYEITLCSEVRELLFKIKFENEYFAKVPIKMVLHGKSTEKMIYGIESNFWYKNISNIVFIKFPGAKKVGIYYSKEKESVIFGKEIEDEIFQINITPLLNRIKDSREKYQYLNIWYEDNQVRWTYLYKILRKVIIKPYFELEFKNDIIGIQVDNIYGKEYSKVFFDVKDSKNGKIIIANRELVEGFNPLPELQRNTLYCIIPYSIETDEFGFEGEKVTLPTRTTHNLMSYKMKKDLSEDSSGSEERHLVIRDYKMDYSNKTLWINRIILNEKELLIDRLIKYSIDDLKEVDDVLEGRLNEIHYIQKYNNPNSVLRTETIHFGRVRVYNYKFEKNKMSFNLETYSNKDDYWDWFYYYGEKKQLLHCDNPLLYKIKYNDAVLLDESTVYEAEMKGNKNDF